MKLVILGIGGMGAITLSKLIAQMAINKGLSVKSSEIHGMAKKGGLVEIQMKINEGKTGVVLQHEADLVILLKQEYFDYASSFLRKGGEAITLREDMINNFVMEFKDIKYISSYVLGLFCKIQDIFTVEDAKKVVENLKDKEKNLKALMRGAR